MGELFAREKAEVAPGAVLVPGWLDVGQQVGLLATCRAWARPPAGMRTVRTPGGGTMSAKQVGLGWHWYPYRYARHVVDGDGSPVKPFPPWLNKLATQALEAAYGSAAPTETYDIGLINFYDRSARMGMHQDKEEASDAPVISMSLGDTCVFRFGNPHSRRRPYKDIKLRSGDLFVFGGPSRMAYHGVPKVYSGSAPAELELDGRVSITLRVSGFANAGNLDRGLPESMSCEATG
ncbi:alpha-ketoglutarate-dependent dioxygenase AlkB [Natronoglycomyces albus]|uniref:Alpha-ketoglutarate-dependent dioxygenase AlkB n=1 Tax=Natronoglycomyces albus TaxID=2811108 RepID=A0A895XED0_9ACTN|nr:alpha-ketoglutarate-dependent dioxygenase AlkB [Natronoglycomyces albus]QSB04181.1 alpha-ketoglutarate-dependent dioxygenase AlkB [Natronoglycomyces albus]